MHAFKTVLPWGTPKDFDGTLCSIGNTTFKYGGCEKQQPLSRDKELLTSAFFLLFSRVLTTIATKKSNREVTGTATRRQKKPMNIRSEIKMKFT